MRLFDTGDVDAALDDVALVDRLQTTFRAGVEMPVRHHHTIAAPTGPGSADAMLLLMPAWTTPPRAPGGQAGRIGVKIVTVFPDNGLAKLPAICGQYLLLDGATGQPLALLDGAMLTKRRTACASGLASRFLSRPDSRRLLMIGTGALAPELIRVHCKIRPIDEVAIWGRTGAHAAALAARLADSLPRDLGRALTVRAVTDRAAAVRDADIISCATLSKTPLVEGAWLRTGQHVDLVGAYTPDMRESDDAAVRAAMLFVDTRDGALKEAGDIVQPLRSGAIDEDDVLADLYALSRGQHRGREPGDRDGITLFKSVGAALEDLAAAELAVENGGAVTPTPLALRDAASSDADALATLFLTARRTAMPWLRVVHTDDVTRRWLANVLVRDYRVRVADAGGTVAGFAVVADGWLKHLYVAPAHQGIGVGSRLLDDAKRLAGAALQLYVFQRNQRARAFYLHRGFVEVAFSDGSGNEEREPDLMMRWTAAP